MTADSSPRRRRFGLSLRGLMVAVLLLGGGFGWFVYRARVRREAVAAIRRAGSFAVYDFQEEEGGGGIFDPPERTWQHWIADHLGPEYAGEVAVVSLHDLKDQAQADAVVARVVRLGSVSAIEGNASNPALVDAHLVQLAGLSSLRYLRLDGSGVSGPDLAHLRGLGQLRVLSLVGLDLPDEALAHLAGLGHLTSLDLSETNIGDDGLARLSGLPSLAHLDLGGTRVTDAGLAHLAALPGLEFVNLSHTKVTDAGAASLRNARPKLAVGRSSDFVPASP